MATQTKTPYLERIQELEAELGRLAQARDAQQERVRQAERSQGAALEGLEMKTLLAGWAPQDVEAARAVLAELQRRMTQANAELRALRRTLTLERVRDIEAEYINRSGEAVARARELLAELEDLQAIRAEAIGRLTAVGLPSTEWRAPVWHNLAQALDVAVKRWAVYHGERFSVEQAEAPTVGRLLDGRTVSEDEFQSWKEKQQSKKRFFFYGPKRG